MTKALHQMAPRAAEWMPVIMLAAMAVPLVCGSVVRRSFFALGIVFSATVSRLSAMRITWAGAVPARKDHARLRAMHSLGSTE